MSGIMELYTPGKVWLFSLVQPDSPGFYVKEPVQTDPDRRKWVILSHGLIRAESRWNDAGVPERHRARHLDEIRSEMEQRLQQHIGGAS